MNTFDNPLSFSERRKIVLNCFPGMTLFPIPDKDDDDAWVQHVLKTVDFDVVVSGEPVTRRCFRDNDIRVEHPPYHQRDQYHATYVREKAASGDESWEQLVPPCSKELLDRFNFVRRMRSLN